MYSARVKTQIVTGIELVEHLLASVLQDLLRTIAPEPELHDVVSLLLVDHVDTIVIVVGCLDHQSVPGILAKLDLLG